jgi:hypothetical protein
VNDDAKRKILARRARFVAAAIAGAGISISCGKSQPCLSVTHIPDPDAAPAPQPCLSEPEPPAPSSTQQAAPMPCLEVAPPPRDAGATKKDGGK